MEVEDATGEKWLILEGYPTWSEPKELGKEKWSYARKELWVHFRSYLVKNEDFNALQEWSGDQDFMGRWMPESHSWYQVFSREYYRTAAHDHFLEAYEGQWRAVVDRKTDTKIAEVIVTAESYMWEEEFDESKNETLSFLKPCTAIYNGMNLKYSKIEGEFLDTKNERVCFAPNVHNDTDKFLLIKKAPLLKYLSENGLKIIWSVLGEKQVLGGSSYPGRLEFSGAYYFDKDDLTGKTNSKTTK